MKTKILLFSTCALAQLLILIVLAPAASTVDEKPKPPGQAESGPGGKDYKHARVTKTIYGKGAIQYWLFEPAEPAPKSAPLIVFNHGWSATDPFIYGAWIEHIVRKGNIVVFPRYQENLITLPSDFTANAIASVKDAIAQLKSEAGHVKPNLDKFAIVGHSAGGLITANMAAMAKDAGLPEPKALMCVQPGKTDLAGFQLVDLSKIPAVTLLLAVAGDADTTCGDTDAKRIFREATAITAANKNFIMIFSDDRGSPTLRATHMSPLAFNEKELEDAKPAAKPQAALSAGLFSGLISGDLSFLEDLLKSDQGKQLRRSTAQMPYFIDLVDTLNALDYYGYWKLFDALCDAAFYSKNREFALGNTTQQRFMGKWSNGEPVKELKIVEKP
jgi:pimeloyl-ACP methyl ester carboxylesterase